MLITKSQLRKLILKEVTSLSPSLKKTLYDAMMSSKFWSFPHSVDDVDLVTDTEFSTPSVERLMDALNAAAELAGTDLFFLLNVEENEMYALGPDDRHGSYPNNWIMRGYYSGPQQGKHVIVIIFRPLNYDYQMSDLDPADLVGKISRTINHEIVHVEQLKKQAISKNISEEQAWEELLRDKKQIPQTQSRSEYLSLHNEIDAYAHEAAEELLDMYTPEEAFEMLRYGRPDASPLISDYYKLLQKYEQRPALNNFLKKVYKQLKNMTSI
mgnify:CR=1 FL=1